jgi:DNA-binding MurR/RpiR family transcriptional regulator
LPSPATAQTASDVATIASGQIPPRSSWIVATVRPVSGETRETVEAFTIARDVGARTIAMTGFVPSTLSRLADLVVQVPVVNPQRYRVGLVDAVMPYLVVLDLLAVRIGAGRDATVLRARVEDTIERRKLRSRSGTTRRGAE